MAKKIDWKKIQREWETTKKTYKELESQFGVKSSTIRSRKNREKWQRNATDATQQKESVATRKKSNVASKKKKASSNGRKKRGGNPNPKNQFTERNQAALKHGLFSRYIPQETLEIMGMLEKNNPADLLWDQIMIQYAAILRAQQIMYVANSDDTAKELKKLKVEHVIDSKGDEVQVPVEKEYEVQFAWDRHANFMNAQSRAMGEFRTSLKQFLEISDENDERRLRLEQMRIGIEKTQAEIDKINSDDDADASKDWTTALQEVAAKRKGQGQ